jgi:hypothetical protein
MKAEKKPFPSLDEFEKWVIEAGSYSQWGDMVEGEDKYLDGVHRRGVLDSFYIIDEVEEEVFEIRTIRTVSRPTPEEVIAQVESKLKSNELTFDRELVEQFLNILKGQDDE